MSLVLGQRLNMLVYRESFGFFYQPFRHLELCRQEFNAKKMKNLQTICFPSSLFVSDTLRQTQAHSLMSSSICRSQALSG